MAEMVLEKLTHDVLRILFRYGLATVIALGLVVWIAFSVSFDIRRMREDLSTHSMETSFYARQTCINTAQTEAQRASCNPPPQMFTVR